MSARLPLNALVLTAGLGTRLRPLTYVRAKPAVPVAGEPLIRRLLVWLAGQQVRDVVLNLHYLPESITSVVGDGSDLGVRVRYSWEPRLLGSAGGPRRALGLLSADPFFLINGDTLTSIDLAGLADHHFQTNAQVTMALVPNLDSRRYGGVLLDGDGWVRGFAPRGRPEPSHHFIGAQLVNPEVFAPLEEGRSVESVGELYPALLARAPHSIRGFVTAAGFMDIGTPGDYLASSMALAALGPFRSDSLRSRPSEPVEPKAAAGARTSIHASARVTRTAIWDDVVVEAGCEVEDSVLTDGVRIPAGMCIRHAVCLAASHQVPAGVGQLRGDLVVVPIAGLVDPVPR